MEKVLIKDILKEAQKHALDFHRYHNSLEIICARNEKRVDNPPPKIVKKPSEWNKDSKYNPFYVIKHHKQIAHSIAKKILNGTYEPRTPITKEIPKKGGGMRTISVYQIPDSAVSDRFYYNLLAKNKHRFSSLAYAYRNDRNIHFAIQDIANELTKCPRMFVAEFDFSNFFGSINKRHLLAQLEENAFLVSATERQVIEAFLKPFEKGIPLGTSISLFLANVACWKLDRQLENEGIRFARYADDTIIWSNDYSRISKAFEIINAFSMESGISINYKKSDGISLLQRKGMPSEFQHTKEYVEFLGYKISTENVGIKDTSLRKIKKQISYLLYRNLIQPIKGESFNNVNIPVNNKDNHFLTAIMQVRRYLYGNLTELTLKKYLNGTYKTLNFKGIMSFYPLITDEAQMIELDRWLVSTIMNSLNLRKKLLLAHNPYFNIEQFPFNISKGDLVRRCKEQLPCEIPSFLRIFKAIRKGIKDNGIEKVMNPHSGYYE